MFGYIRYIDGIQLGKQNKKILKKSLKVQKFWRNWFDKNSKVKEVRKVECLISKEKVEE